MSKLRVMTIDAFNNDMSINLERYEYTSLDDFTCEIYDGNIAGEFIHAVSYHPKFEDGIIDEYTFRLFNDEYQIIGTGIIKYYQS